MEHLFLQNFQLAFGKAYCKFQRVVQGSGDLSIETGGAETHHILYNHGIGCLTNVNFHNSFEILLKYKLPL